MSGQAAFDKPVRSAALCRGETAEDGKLERHDEADVNGVEEERDEMPDEERDEVGEEQTDTKGERNTKPRTYRSETGAPTA